MQNRVIAKHHRNPKENLKLDAWFTQGIIATDLNGYLVSLLKKFGRIMYSVRTDRGVWRRHANQLQLRVDNSRTDDKNTTTQTDASEPESKVLPRASMRENMAASPIQPKVSTRRYPMRIRKQPNWYQA